MEHLSKQNNIEERLTAVPRTQLSLNEKEELWNRIVMVRQTQRESLRFFTFMYSYQPVLVSTLVVFFLALGVGTATASNKAVPGDILFTVDRAVEDVWLAFADDTEKNDLRIAFAKERVEEVQQIIHEEQPNIARRIALNTPIQNELSKKETFETMIISPNLDDDSLTQADATVIGNQTFINVEINGVQRQLSTTTKDRERIIDTIAETLGVERPVVEQVLVIEEEGEKKDVPVRFREDEIDLSVPRVKEGITSAIAFLQDVSEEFDRDGNEEAKQTFAGVIDALNNELATLPSDVVLEALGSQDETASTTVSENIVSDIETSEEENAYENIRIEIKEGQVRIHRPLIPAEIENPVPRVNPIQTSSTTKQVLSEEPEEFELPDDIKVYIDDDRAEVRFEMNDTKHKAFFPYTTTEILVANIATAYDLTEEMVRELIEIRD